MICTDRLDLAILDAAILESLAETPAALMAFTVPAGWPDGDDVEHVEIWRQRAAADGTPSPWRARAVVHRETGAMVGHAGFHEPPQPLASALADPTFAGALDPAEGLAVELGYTIFEPHRGMGYAVEAASALVRWALGHDEVSTVIATVRPSNGASRAVLDRVGGFVEIGTCADDGETELVLRRDRPLS